MGNLNTSDLPILGLLAGVLIISYVLLRSVIFPIIKRGASKTSTYIDDLFLDKKFLNRISYVFVFVLYNFLIATPQFSLDIFNTEISSRVSSSLLTLFIGLTLLEMLNVLNKVSENINSLKNKPIKGYVQIIKIALNSFIFIIIFAIITGQPVSYYISGLGALTAVLLLVFQDTILSFIASVQIGQNNIIKNGDWIEVPEYGADGDVIDIALHTVKVQNWDKTITTIPTSKIVTTSVKNWRGMSEYGGRRIKRSVSIDISSIKFMEDKDIDKLKEMPLISRYLSEKILDIEKYNASIGGEKERRRLTNLGTLRAYLLNYLKNHDGLNTETMTLLVRQLAPTAVGVPLELYTFTNTTDWVEYEGIQSDIFDHVFAVLPKFGLRAFQEGTVEAAATRGLPMNDSEL
ncbi:MAG: mechanosensitive ion channel [Candidatus Actinomarina sp.]|jgi:miniconductance mechanosensitive channel|nr:mechanosensitive ion channel [Candidatus Actinomarina sp.]MBL6836644.1 mechanosensitive ion channel [Candidatus Actinomarina sp.]MDB4823561.1 mechanosensitive ion channel family protein [Acidimicrobiia bacterium]